MGKYFLLFVAVVSSSLHGFRHKHITPTKECSLIALRSNNVESDVVDLTSQPTKENIFVFTTCQVGSEKLLKADIASTYPDFKLAFSRPGLVTFKVSPTISQNLNIQSIFARSYGISTGNGKTSLDVIDKAMQLRDSLSGSSIDNNKQIRFRLHVWGRGEPFPSADHPDAIVAARNRVDTITQELLELGHQHNLWMDPSESPSAAAAGDESGDSYIDDIFDDEEVKVEEEYVFDVIVPTGPFIEESMFLGYHTTSSRSLDNDSNTTNIHTSNRRSEWPGGDPRIGLPPEAPSRAYLKIEEAIAWTGAPVHSGQVAVEVGSAPGGASYALLQRGVTVVGIDPCPIDRQHDAVVANHPRFSHIKARLSDVSRDQLPTHVDWLICDANVPPQVLLPQLTALVREMQDTLLGVIITLKLFDTPAPTVGSRSSRAPLSSSKPTESVSTSISTSSNTKKWSSSKASSSIDNVDSTTETNKLPSLSPSSSSPADITIANIKSLLASMSSPPRITTTTASNSTPLTSNIRKPINNKSYTRSSENDNRNTQLKNDVNTNAYMGLVAETIKATHLPSNRQEVCAFGLTQLGLDYVLQYE